MNRFKSLSAASLTLLLLAACSSSGIGDILGGSGSQGTYEIRGTVDSVDPSSRTILLTNVSGYNMLSSGNTVRVYYDERTPVEYQGQTYRPENLERGDQVAVRVDESGNTLVAESVTVLRDASGGTTGGYETTLRGTVRTVDTSRRTIEIDRGYGSSTIVEYDTSTPVYFGSQAYRVTDLERGDEIEVRYRDLGSSRFLATGITVTRSIRGGTSGSSTAVSTLRGTVRWVDTANRTMELESVSWIQRFTGTGTSGNIATVRFDTNANVEVQGRLYPVDNLERGDVVEVQARTSGSTLFADRIVLVRNVRQ